MAILRFLGTSNSIPDLEHGNTHMLISIEDHNILIDCPGDIIQRMLKLNISPDHISELILTHFHPDHVGGVSLLLMSMWLQKRTKPLAIYGNHHTIKSVISLMENSGWQSWPDFYPVEFITILETQEGISPVLETETLRVTSAFGDHFLPTNALRFDFLKCGHSVAYSSDTEPCEEFVQLAKGAEIMIHESTGSGTGHSSSVEAAEIANRAGATDLYLIHYQARNQALEEMQEQARSVFKGEVHLARDFETITFDCP